MRKVIFLGAGASKAVGLPLTKDILVEIVEKLESRSKRGKGLFRGSDRFKPEVEEDALRQGLQTLYPGIELKASREDLKKSLPMITDVLSFLDYSILYEQPAALKFRADNLLRLRRLLERGICEVLGLRFYDSGNSLDGRDDAGELLAEMGRSPEQLAVPKDSERAMLQDFVGWIAEQHNHGTQITVITTNYDTAVETGIYREMGYEKVRDQIDFGLDWRLPDTNGPGTGGVIVTRPVKPEYAIYKLHGSLNWLRCDLCGQVYIHPRSDIAYLSFYPKQLENNTCHCGYYPLRHLIVAPSMVRDVRDTHLLSTWKSATEALRTADEWIIIGYSLPPEDLAIRSMLVRAYRARGSQPSVTVVQQSNSVKLRYGALFPNYTYREDGLRAFIPHA